MGKYEAEPRSRVRKKGGSKRKIVLIAVLAVITALILLAVYILVPPPAQQQQPPVAPDVPEHNQPVNGESGNGDAQQGGEKNPEPQRQLELKKNFYTFLLVGTNDNYNTDTIMLGSVDTETYKVNMISIPRDTMVDVPAKIKRINGAYGREGIEELCREVGEVTGVYPQYYCVLNVESFTKVVDLVGGVEFNVEKDMYHADADRTQHIDLKAGWQTLDSHKALQYVRFRSDSENDFGRINRQKEFLMAVLNKVKNNFSLDKTKGMIEVINESVKTNMSTRDMIWFYVNVAMPMNFSEDITFYTMPYAATGIYQKQHYVYLDDEQVIEMVNQTVNPYTTDLTTDDVHIIRLED